MDTHLVALCAQLSNQLYSTEIVALNLMTSRDFLNVVPRKIEVHSVVTYKGHP